MRILTTATISEDATNLVSVYPAAGVATAVKSFAQAKAGALLYAGEGALSLRSWIAIRHATQSTSLSIPKKAEKKGART